MYAASLEHEHAHIVARHVFSYALCMQTQALHLLGHPYGIRSSSPQWEVHGESTISPLKTPVQEMGSYWANDSDSEMNESWQHVDYIISHSFADIDKQWYQKATYCPSGLTPQVAGRAYLHRYKLLLEAIRRVFRSAHYDSDAARLQDLEYILHAAIFSHQVIQLRGVTLGLSGSYIEYDSEKNVYYRASS